MSIKEEIKYLLNCGHIELVSGEINVSRTEIPKEEYSRGKLILITDGKKFYYVNKNTVLIDYPEFLYFKTERACR